MALTVVPPNVPAWPRALPDEPAAVTLFSFATGMCIARSYTNGCIEALLIQRCGKKLCQLTLFLSCKHHLRWHGPKALKVKRKNNKNNNKNYNNNKNNNNNGEGRRGGKGITGQKERGQREEGMGEEKRGERGKGRE